MKNVYVIERQITYNFIYNENFVYNSDCQRAVRTSKDHLWLKNVCYEFQITDYMALENRRMMAKT
ncbi:hypothetical protein RhiirA4_490611 [Rhizophagus irregularis]|uniref:Uncharacterized protein n=1 Tax=Rhizophagus irregularis TaxID=588596 RepID=A0A2I1HVU0_9GLOM|nr:hypothetical protein RhiirA4_490611 [Rhizophagus irregularis]